MSPSCQLFRRPLPQPNRLRAPSAPPLQTLGRHQRYRHRFPVSPACAPPSPRRSAIDATFFLVAAVASASIAYIATASSPPAEGEAGEAQGLKAAIATGDEGIMAAKPPPARPGNLTSEQERKLKEMWMQTLDVFGVSAEDSAAPTDGTATPSSTSESPEKQKQRKRKGRLSLFGKKAKTGGGGGGVDGDALANSSDGAENDKHGQTQEFKQALASHTPEQLRDAFWSMVKHDHPDALLLRFLRARKWDVHAALIMLISTMHWRSSEMHVDDDIMLRGESHALRESQSSDAAAKKEGGDFMAQLRMGKSFLHGTDKDSRPCCYVRVRLHRQGEQSDKSLERFTVYTIETARMLLRPPVDTATIVFDMTDFSMANMDYTPVKFMIKCFEANYPESLGSVLVYKSPFIFSAIWKIIKGWLDPVVASKVHFCSNVGELEAWIPRAQIMKELGGDEAYTYTYPEPAADEDGQLQDSASREKIQAERTELVKSYESDTLAWIHGEDTGEGRGRLAQRLAESYWRLDPFVRARSMYDRTGVIRKGGRLDFYPSAAKGRAGGDDEVD